MCWLISRMYNIRLLLAVGFVVLGVLLAMRELCVGKGRLLRVRRVVYFANP